MQEHKVCIIGAGSSGIAVAKVLSEVGIPFDCFEKGSRIGGNWLYNNDNGMSSVYHSLNTNTSTQMMAYSDFPMPETFPDYPGHALVYQYFEDYVDHFGFRETITFNTTVEKIGKLGDNNYLVYTDHSSPKEYTAVIVANGHHWSPKWADFEGEFTGTTSHSHHYKTYKGLEGKRVLIVGIGNSAVDIACELTTVASSVAVSTRSGAHIIPKYLFGFPTDHLSKPPLGYSPPFIQRMVLKIALLLNVGKQTNYGLPVPKRAILKEHPTMSQDFLGKVGQGKINIKPNIKRFNGCKVHFEDGTAEDYDHILYSTGYEIKFPFLDDDIFKVDHNRLELYQYVVPPENPGLYFIGFIQPAGAIMPIAELQALWVARIIKDLVRLPSVDEMNRWIIKNRQKLLNRYGHASRHTIEIDFFPYFRRLKKMARIR